MDRQSLRDWVYRFNQAGPEGLHDHKSPGAVPKLTAVERVWRIRRQEMQSDAALRPLQERPQQPGMVIARIVETDMDHPGSPGITRVSG